MKIWKYTLHMASKQFIDIPKGAKPLYFDIPKGAKPLYFGIQGNQICLWAKVDPTADKERREVRMFGTGEEIEDDGDWGINPLEHIGTVVLPNLEVYHYFWRLG